MRIFQLSNSRACEADPEARSLAASAFAFAAAGHEVLLVTPADDCPRAPGRPHRFAHELLRPAARPGVDSPTSVYRPSVPPFAVRESGAAAADEAPAPDVIHAHHPFLTGEEALRLAELHPAPLVFTARLRYESPCPLPPAEAVDLRAFIEKLGVCYANRCDLVIAPSSALAVRLFEGGVVRPIRVVPDAHDPEAAARRAQRLLECYAEIAETRRARGPVRECGQTARLRRELALAWEKIHPAARSGAGRSAAALSFFRDGTALPC